MESKRLPTWKPLAYRMSFNRTSMESKLVRKAQRLLRVPHTLLIEPVWNRNYLQSEVHRKRRRLLIEPVWNRNAHVQP